jgi:hypothetical protein
MIIQSNILEIDNIEDQYNVRGLILSLAAQFKMADLRLDHTHTIPFLDKLA